MEKFFIIFDVTEINNIDFEQLLTTSIESLRYSVDGTKTFVKYEGEELPSTLNSLLTKQGPYNYEQMLSIIHTPEWTVPYSGMS